MISFLFQHSRRGEKSRLWSARVRLDEWPRARTFPLHVTDKRVADQKLRDLVSELERETHGIGIPRGQLKRIFRRFYRVPGQRVARVKGTGLGLFIVQSIIKRHGGKVRAESEGEGMGSTFIVQLPKSA